MTQEEWFCATDDNLITMLDALRLEPSNGAQQPPWCRLSPLRLGRWAAAACGLHRHHNETLVRWERCLAGDFHGPAHLLLQGETANWVYPRPGAAALLRCVTGTPWRPVDRVNIQHWLTPAVRALASAALDHAGHPCGRCQGKGSYRRCMHCYNEWVGDFSSECVVCDHQPLRREVCYACKGHGRMGMLLDRQRLLVLSDAVEEAMQDESCLVCVRCQGYAADAPAGDRWHMCGLCNGAGHLPHPVLEHLRSVEPHCTGCWALSLLLGEG